MSRKYNTPLALRHRSHWEALDAGLLLWRENFAFLLLFFALPLWICAFALRLIPEQLRYLSWLSLWLLRPLFERPALHVISVRFFEKGAGLKRLSRGLSRTIFRGLAADLTWRRFSPLRAAMTPVRTLEALNFKQVNERRRILKKGKLDFCSVLTIWALVMEAVLLGGGVIFCLISMEIIQPGLYSAINETIDSWEIFIYAAWCINSMLTGSLYVCMGFSLYLNCRIELEGWDIEILFKQLAEKNRGAHPAQAVIMIFLISALSLLPVKTWAEAPPPDKTAAENIPQNVFLYSDEIPLETLHDILDSPDFGGEKDGWGIRLKPNNTEKTRPEINLNIAPFFKKIKNVFALMLRTILIGLIVFLAVLLIMRLLKYRGRRSLFTKGGTVRTLPAAAGINPQDLLAQSQDLFSQGKLRRAWGLCIAALFRSLTVYHGIAFPCDATEYDCLNIIHNAIPGQKDTLAVPVNYWVAFAYGGQLPPDNSYRDAVACCISLAEEQPSTREAHE